MGPRKQGKLLPHPEPVISQGRLFLPSPLSLSPSSSPSSNQYENDGSPVPSHRSTSTCIHRTETHLTDS
ncbi:hypothetical protein DM02DRAFT_612869 [Periconia macrospinosa]|uniref:Uncharacterized protein n=1 Tax=Periconia macrospinosa TaxID=97972 RepID=A0A2V1DVT5_9PLEO|nr:hypothetical protein DM02DRAFT_612869 [Periconia macrospinosa]